MWNYVYYNAYLQYKDKTEYNGDESYVADKISNFDVSWIPSKRTSSISATKNLDEEKIKQIKIAKAQVLLIFMI